MDYAAVWLPCGLQNFFRVNGEVQPKLPFEEETALFDHLGAKLAVIGTPVLDPARNMCFAWFRVGRQRRLYADSDGFIVTVGSKKLLPPLAPEGYSVRRSSKHLFPESGNGQTKGASWLLSNFQLNLLLEGIWNSAFDPAVFLMSDVERARGIMESFTIGSLLAELTVTGELPRVDTSLALSVALRRSIFLRALRILRNEHLLPLKWNVEATRRHLFSETMTMLHRPERLVQFASPHGAERDALFTKSSDEQLRGYVMLISAKLPLIDNLTFLAQDCLHALVLDSEEDNGAKGEVQVLRDVFTSWDGTAKALHRNVDALERSFTSIWQDQLLHETEQVRIEEEALGELQRQQALDKTTRWFDTLIFVITLGVSFAALYFAAGGAAVLHNHTASVWEIAAVIVAVASIVFWIGPRGFGHMLGDYLPRYEQVTRLDEILTFDAITTPTRDVEWMDLPLLDAQLLDLRRPERDGRLRRVSGRILLTKRMRRWINLQLPRPYAGERAAGYLPVGYHTGDRIPRIRVDTPSAIDTYARIHVDLSLILPPRRIMAKGRFRRKYSPVSGLTGWKNRFFASYSESLPRRRVTAQCVLELHKHSPDPGESPLYFVRELRLILSSRAELTHHETIALVQIIDAALLEPLVKPELPRGAPSFGRHSLLTDRLSSPPRNAETTLVPPPVRFRTWDDFVTMNESDRLLRCEDEAKAASQNGRLPWHNRKHLDGQGVYFLLNAARGRCHYCKSLALENRPAGWEDAPSLWAPMGRRIGTVAYYAEPAANGFKGTIKPIWCCLWCKTWPDERKADAPDHGGNYAAKN